LPFSCSTQDHHNVVGLALTREALDASNHELGITGQASEHTHVLFNEAIYKYVYHTPHGNLWHRIGNSKLCITLAGLEAGYQVFVIEMDVLLLRPPKLLLPKHREYDVATMYCPPTGANNRIILGFSTVAAV
jgi:hypothetical protein